jgi:hypothetical protein
MSDKGQRIRAWSTQSFPLAVDSFVGWRGDRRGIGGMVWGFPSKQGWESDPGLALEAS